jgi:sugar lactone lactonase YvrE
MRTNATHPGPLLSAYARVLLRVCLLLVGLAALPAQAQRMPQDSWYLAKELPIPIFEGMFQGPGCSAFGPDGNLYVTDTSNGNIQVFDADGKFIKVLFKDGQDNIRLGSITGMAISDDGSIYLLQQWNMFGDLHIFVLDKDGKFIKSFGKQGSGDGQIYNPQGIALDNLGNVYISEPDLKKVSIFKNDGTFLKTWGSSSQENNQFASLYSICRTIDNNIAFSDLNSRRIKVFNPEGTLISEINLNFNENFGLSFYPRYLAQDSAGNFYISDSWQSKVAVFSPTGERLQSFGSNGVGDAQFKQLRGIIVKGDKIYLSDTENARIVVFKTDGSWLKNFGTRGRPELGQMRGIAQDASGNIFISDYDHACVRKFDSQGRLLKSFGGSGTGDGNLNNPDAIALGKDQKLYVVDRGNTRIQIFDSEGNPSGGFGSPGASNKQFNDPSGIAIGTNGTVYVSDSQNNCVQAFNPDGTFLFKFGAPGALDAQFNRPSKLSVSPIDGKLAVCDEGNNRVQLFDANGNFLNKVSVYGGDFWAARNNLYNSSSYQVRQSSPSSPSEVNFLGDGCFVAYVPNGVELANLFSETGELIHFWQTKKLNYYPFDPSVNGSLNEALNKTDQDYYSLPSSIKASCANISGDLYTVTSRGNLQLWKRTYRVQQPPQANALPFPYILSQSRRAGTSLVDVDYIVKDADDDSVQTAALAFKDGGNTLRHVIPIASLAEGTAANLGANVTTGQPHRFTWDAKSDWNTDFGEVQIEILAKDKRDLLNLDFIQIPAVKDKPDKPALKISRSPLTDDDFLSVWYWFLATGDPGITLNKGEINSANIATQTDTVKYDGKAGKPGWNAHFYPNTNWLNGVDRNDLFCNLRPGSPHESEVLPFDSSSFIVNYTGILIPSQTGTYRFFGSSIMAGNVAAYFQINTPIAYGFDSWSQKIEDHPYVDVPLTAGTPASINLRVHCYNGADFSSGRFGEIQLSWQRPDGVIELVPPSNVFTGNSEAPGELIYNLPNREYALGTKTSAYGRRFILQKMGLREATAAEVLRAKEAGTPGNINQWEPKFQVGPWERPLKVNAYGFDTGASGTWVVPLNN